MLNMVVTQRIKPGMETRAEALLREAEIETTTKHAGCLRYEWYRSSEPSTYILIERWTDQAAVQAHLAALGATGLMAQLGEVAAEKFTVQRIELLTD